MIPGEIDTLDGELELNVGRSTLTITVANTGDRPIQVGSHYHFFETNEALAFDREQARGMRLNIPAGTAVRFEPGQSREVMLVAYGGSRKVFGTVGFIAPENYVPMLTFQVWAMLIVGGSGNNRGAVLGAVLIWAVWRVARRCPLSRSTRRPTAVRATTSPATTRPETSALARSTRR